MKKKLFLKGWVCLVMALCFSACSLFIDDDDDEEVEAQVPQILSVGEDVATVINMKKSISVTAKTNDNGTLSYQWYESSSKISKGSAISQAVESSYTPPTNAVGTLYYYCEVTNTLGSSTKSVISPYITYKVSEHIEAQKPVIATQCENVAQDFGTTFKLSVSAVSKDGGVLSYQWYFSATQDGSFTALSTKTASTLEDTVSKDSLGYYYCAVTNTIEDNGDGGAKTATENTNTVIVSNNVINANMPTITAQPVSVIMVIPATNEFTVGAYSPDGELSYQWYEVAEGESNGSPISGATESKYKATKDTIGTFGYYCVITNTIADNGDGGVKTASITSETAYLETDYISNFIQAVFTTQPTALSIAPMNESITLSAQAEASGSEISYRWYESATGTTDDGVAISGANTNTLSVPATSEKGSRYYYCVATATLGTARAVTASLSAISSLATVVCTGLPTVYVNTPSTATSEITKEEYAEGNLKIFSQTYGNLTNTLSIKGRGNSSWNQPKKGYNIKFEKKQSLFGLEKSKKWCLIANYSDKSLIRNKYASYLGNDIFNAEWNPHFVCIDFVFNGEYIGTYTLSEKIGIGTGRIDIQDIADVEEYLGAGKTNKITDTNSDGNKDLSDGGFVLEVDARLDGDFAFKTSKNVPFVLKDPDEVSTNIQERVKEIVQNAEDVLYGNDFKNSESGWRKYIDESSIIDWYLTNEFCKNNDAIFFSSVYMYYNPTDSKLHLGPNWDFDISCGNINYNDCDKTDGFWIKGAAWISRMFEDSSFISAVKSRWNEKKSEVYSSVVSQIQSMADDIEVSANANFTKWQILGTYVWPNADGYESRTTYQSEIDYLKSWCSNRYTWLDSAINAL